MEKRIKAFRGADFDSRMVNDGDKVIFLGEKYYRERKGGGRGKDKMYVIDNNSDVLAVNLNHIRDITSDPDEPEYPKFRAVCSFIGKNVRNGGCKIYIVDDSEGEVATKVLKLYEYNASFYDKALLGLGLHF